MAGVPDARPSVVLADDDTASTANLAPFLGRAGFDVHMAAGGQAALDEGADDYLNKPFDPHELVARDWLLEVLWGFDFPGGTCAVDNRAAELRRALGDDAARPDWIETVAGQGYRFTARVDEPR